MNLTTSMTGTGIVVLAGQWAEAKPIDIKIVIGASVLFFGLSLIHSADSNFAEQFGLFIFIVALFKYTIPIAKKLNIGKK